MGNSALKAEILRRAIATMRALDQQYVGEEAYARNILESVANAKTLICKNCSFENSFPKDSKRNIKCQRCHKFVWCTVGTFYEQIRLFRPRKIIICWAEDGTIPTANQAAEALGVANGTVDLIYKQLGIVASCQMKDSAVEIPTQLLSEIITRRTKKTPANEAPIMEELAVQEKQQQQSISVNDPFNQSVGELSVNESLVINLLMEESLGLDSLIDKCQLSVGDLSSTLMFLDLRGILETLPGPRYRYKKPDHFRNSAICSDFIVESLAREFIEYVKEFFQGVGRKYLQPYGGLRWFVTDRDRWARDSLLNLCASFPKISYEEIMAYDTAPTMLLVPT